MIGALYCLIVLCGSPDETKCRAVFSGDPIVCANTFLEAGKSCRPVPMKFGTKEEVQRSELYQAFERNIVEE